MKYKIFGLLLACLFLVSLGSAEDYPSHKQGTDFEFSFTSNNATSCELTTADTPYGVIDLSQAATKDGQTFNSSVSSDKLTELGNYCFNIVCSDGSKYASGEKCINLTASGFKNTIGFYGLILVLSLGIVILGLSIRDAPVTILGSFGLYFLGLYILFYGLADIKDPVYTWGSGLIILGLAFYISVRSTYELIVD